MFTSRDRLLLVLAVAGIALLTPVAFVVTAGRATDPGQSAPPTDESDDESPPGFHIFRPSPPDGGVSDPRSSA